MSAPHVTLDLILESVSAISGISRRDLVSKRKPEKTVRARLAVYWLARELTGLTSGQIGLALGDRDHSTILHGMVRADELRAADAEFRHVSDALHATLSGLHRAGIMHLIGSADPVATSRRILAAPDREAVRVPVSEIVAMAELIIELTGEPEPTEPMENSYAA